MSDFAIGFIVGAIFIVVTHLAAAIFLVEFISRGFSKKDEE